MLPNDNPQPGADVSRSFVERLLNIYAEIMERSACHIDPLEGIRWDYDHLSPDELVMIGHVFLALAQWKPTELTETPGVTRVTPDGAGVLGDKFPGCNSVTELPSAPKMPYLAPIGRGKR